MASTRALAAALCLTVMAGGCSDDAGGSATTTTASRPSNVEVDETSDLTFEVGDDLALVVEPGDFSSAGTVRTVNTVVDAPSLSGFEPASDPVDLDIAGEVADTLTLRFDGTAGPAGTVPMILRYDRTDGWYPIAVSKDLGPVTAERMSFSPLSWGWAKIQDLSDDVAAKTRDLLGDRHDPPECASAPPAWFSVDPPGVDVVLVCAASNPDPASGTARGEIQVVNNRGVVLEVQVPASVAYAFVDGQPEPIRAAVRAFTGRDSVLLAPGQLMTVGFTQPSKSSYTPLRVDYTAPAALATGILEAVGHLEGYAAVYKALAECGAAPKPLDARLGADDFESVASTALACFANLASDPQGAATLAAEAVAASNNVSVAVATSDAQFAGKVDSLAGNLRKAAVAFAVVSAGSKIIDAMSDLYLNTEVGDWNSLSPAITRTAPPKPPAPKDDVCAAFEAVWDGGGVGFGDFLTDAENQLEVGGEPGLYGPFVAGQPFKVIMLSSTGESLLQYTASPSGWDGPVNLGGGAYTVVDLPDVGPADYLLEIGIRGVAVSTVGAQEQLCQFGF